jgi:hypothetical protein
LVYGGFNGGGGHHELSMYFLWLIYPEEKYYQDFNFILYPPNEATRSIGCGG